MSPSMGETVRRFLKRLGGRSGTQPLSSSARTREPAAPDIAGLRGTADRDPTRSGIARPGSPGELDPTDYH